MPTLRVRNRPLTKQDAEFIAGTNVSGTINQVLREQHPPSDIEVKLANELLWYRDWIEVIYDIHHNWDGNRELMARAFMYIKDGRDVGDTKLYSFGDKKA